MFWKHGGGNILSVWDGLLLCMWVGIEVRKLTDYLEHFLWGEKEQNNKNFEIVRGF